MSPTPPTISEKWSTEDAQLTFLRQYTNAVVFTPHGRGWLKAVFRSEVGKLMGTIEDRETGAYRTLPCSTISLAGSDLERLSKDDDFK